MRSAQRRALDSCSVPNNLTKKSQPVKSKTINWYAMIVTVTTIGYCKQTSFGTRYCIILHYHRLSFFDSPRRGNTPRVQLFRSTLLRERYTPGVLRKSNSPSCGREPVCIASVNTLVKDGSQGSIITKGHGAGIRFEGMRHYLKK